MTYVFSGLIGFDRALDWDGLMDRLGGVQRDVETPFTGRVHALGADYRLHEPADWERTHLLEFSKTSGNSPLIGLIVECFGGTCEQRAVLFQAGARVEAWESADGKDAVSALEHALNAAGQPVSTGAMPFLERGTFIFDDEANMRRALALARRHQGKTGDNPSVGCVLIDPRGEIIAEAVTGETGRPHAEETALEEAGTLAENCTAYVTLEPCRQRSSATESCSERLIEAGIARVVIATRDPHPNGAGGIARLEAAGIPHTLGVCQQAADALYEEFFARARNGD